MDRSYPSKHATDDAGESKEPSRDETVPNQDERAAIGGKAAIEATSTRQSPRTTATSSTASRDGVSSSRGSTASSGVSSSRGSAAQAERYRRKVGKFQEAGMRNDEHDDEANEDEAARRVARPGGDDDEVDDDSDDDEEDDEELLPGAYAVPGPQYRGSAREDSFLVREDTDEIGGEDEIIAPPAVTDQTFEGEVIAESTALAGDEEAGRSSSAEMLSRSQSGTVVLSAEIMPAPKPEGGSGAVAVVPTTVVAKAESEEVYTKRKRKRDRSVCAAALLLVVVLAVTIGVALALLPSPSNSESSNGRPTNTQDSRFDGFREIFSSYSDPQTLEGSDPPSPQYQALNWLANVDTRQVPVPPVLTGNESSDVTAAYYDVIQRYAAAVFYFSLGGPSWEEQLNFLSAEDECLWNMVGNDGFKCGKVDENVESDLFVITRVLIDLDTTYLNGTLPEEISLFRQIESISLATNDIRGTIPSSIGSLGATLSTVNLEGNKLTGTIPTSLSQLEKLSILQLNDNQLTGSVPQSFENLTNLGFVFLQNNELTGSLDPLCNDSYPIEVFAADCDPAATSTVACTCCTVCYP